MTGIHHLDKTPVNSVYWKELNVYRMCFFFWKFAFANLAWLLMPNWWWFV